MSNVSTDPIADMLTRIRNAVMAHKNEITLPHSKLKESIALILKDNRFVDNVSVSGEKSGFKTLSITIHSSDTNARITEIARLSTPGRRWYSSSEEIPKIKRGRGIVIISTSQGIMTDSDARSKHLGGELICKVY